MKTLFLIRHAKSSRDDPTLSYKERPLNDRGRRDAPRMGERLAKQDARPDLILSSPAVRALATAEITAKKLNYDVKDMVVDERLYAAAPGDLLEIIHGLGDKIKRVMLRDGGTMCVVEKRTASVLGLELPCEVRLRTSEAME